MKQQTPAPTAYHMNMSQFGQNTSRNIIKATSAIFNADTRKKPDFKEKKYVPGPG